MYLPAIAAGVLTMIASARSAASSDEAVAMTLCALPGLPLTKYESPLLPADVTTRTPRSAALFDAAALGSSGVP